MAFTDILYQPYKVALTIREMHVIINITIIALYMMHVFLSTALNAIGHWALLYYMASRACVVS